MVLQYWVSTQDSASLTRSQMIMMLLVFRYTLTSEILDSCRSLLQHVWAAQLLGQWPLRYDLSHQTFLGDMLALTIDVHSLSHLTSITKSLHIENFFDSAQLWPPLRACASTHWMWRNISVPCMPYKAWEHKVQPHPHLSSSLPPPLCHFLCHIRRGHISDFLGLQISFQLHAGIHCRGGKIYFPTTLLGFPAGCLEIVLREDRLTKEKPTNLFKFYVTCEPSQEMKTQGNGYT